MKLTIIKLSTAIFTLFLMNSCGNDQRSFNDQIINDINRYIGKVKCDSVPIGAVISNIKVGEITPLEGMQMTDVSIEFDYKKDGKTKHRTSALLYLGEKLEGRHKLAAIGGCEYGKK